MTKKPYLFTILLAALLAITAACTTRPDYGETAQQPRPTKTAQLDVALQYQSTNYNTGLTGNFRVRQNPANDCSNPGALVMEEPTSATEPALSLALLGVPTSNQDPNICTDGTNYCLELEEDDPNTVADEGWILSWANLGATLSDPQAWTDIPDADVSMTSANPMPITICEGLDIAPTITFEWVDDVLMFGVGVADVMLEVDTNSCAGDCGTTAANVGDLVCALVNSSTDPLAAAECVASCENNDDCTTSCPGNMPGLCVGGGTPFPTNRPGVCYCR